jgi:hypothetical protein
MNPGIRFMLLLAAASLFSEHPAVAAGPVVTVDWTRVLKNVDPKAYGVDCPACLDPAWTHSADLLRPLASMAAGGKPLIRLHGWGMVTHGSNECWLNPDNTWNAPKIKSALTPLIRAGYQLLIDIPSGPGGEPDVRDPMALASFAASLVRIVNVDNGFGVRYWEIPNEREHLLDVKQMTTLLSLASKAMKRVDSTIWVGGPATEGVNVEYITAVVQNSLPDIDFVSAHTYGGDGTQADSVSYASAIKAVADVRMLRTRLSQISKGKYLPIFIDEYNVGWDTTPKILTNEGAVYFSLIQGGVVDAGGDASAIWDFSPPHNMSVVDSHGNFHASAHLFSLLNQYFQGKKVSALLSDDTGLRVYAVNASVTHSLLISNLGDSQQSVTLSFQGPTPIDVRTYEISPQGYSGPRHLKWSRLQSEGLKIPPKSVAILISP